MVQEKFDWNEKYRPKKLADTILPIGLKTTFQSFLDKNHIPNLLLIGPSGSGKTTIAQALLDELGLDYIKKNGSLEGRNIDTLRTDMQSYASSMSFRGGRKYIILDEADGISNINQMALRNFTELFSGNCGFIFTANYAHKIIEPIHSRCVTLDFHFPSAEYNTLAMQYLKRLAFILSQENTPFDKPVLVQLLKKFYPDFRRILNEVQKYAQTGAINSGIFANLKDFVVDDVVSLLKNKDFNALRTWVAENLVDVEQEVIYKELYKHSSSFLDEKKIPLLVLTLAKYQYQSYFAVDEEINMMACLTELMVDCF